MRTSIAAVAANGTKPQCAHHFHGECKALRKSSMCFSGPWALSFQSRYSVEISSRNQSTTLSPVVSGCAPFGPKTLYEAKDLDTKGREHRRAFKASAKARNSSVAAHERTKELDPSHPPKWSLIVCVCLFLFFFFLNERDLLKVELLFAERWHDTCLLKFIAHNVLPANENWSIWEGAKGYRLLMRKRLYQRFHLKRKNIKPISNNTHPGRLTWTLKTTGW